MFLLKRAMHKKSTYLLLMKWGKFIQGLGLLFLTNILGANLFWTIESSLSKNQNSAKSAQVKAYA